MEKLKIEILKILKDNPLMDREIIGAMVGSDKATVEALIAEMENEGIILKYTTVIDWDKVHKEQTVYARIDVQVQPQRDVGFNDLARRISRFQEVKSMMLVSGQFDFSIMVEAPTMMDVSNFVSGKLATIDGVKSTWTNFVLKKYKENEVIYGESEVDHRQAVSL